MTEFIVQQVAGAGAPDIEPDIYDATFDGIVAEAHPDWAGVNSFGKPDSGDRWRFNFTLLDEDGAVMYDPNSEGDPIEVNVLTNQTMGEKSNAYKIMRGICTPAEMALIDAKQPFNAATLYGRKVQLQIEKNENGWPKITNVLPARRSKGSK